MPQGAALITGATSGIGAELARLCAAGGFPVILAGRNRTALTSLAAELGGRAYPVDLSVPEAPEALFREIQEQPLDILINCAGFALRGAFAQTDWEAEARLLQVNVTSLAHLTKLALPGMLRRRSGRILNVASTAAFVPGPYMAFYYASKAFVLSFSESLWKETENTGVTVTALCPGPTRTPFFETAGMTDSNLVRGPIMDAAEVAREGYDAMMAGRMEVIAGARNRWKMRGARLAPRAMLAGITKRLNLGTP